MGVSIRENAYVGPRAFEVVWPAPSLPACFFPVLPPGTQSLEWTQNLTVDNALWLLCYPTYKVVGKHQLDNSGFSHLLEILKERIGP